MQKSVSILICTLLSVLADGDVLKFTDTDFEEKIKDYEIILVKFYAPWCGHCKKLAPEFEKAATKLKKNDPPVHLAEVDCTEEKKTCDKYGVQGFPTLKIFRNGGSPQEYQGPREADGIVKYMKGQSGPSAKEIKEVKEFEKILESDDGVVCGFFESESKLKDSFLKVADTERDRFQFIYTANKELLKKYEHTDDIVVFIPKKLHNKFESNYFQYDGNYDTEKIKEFLVHETVGLAGVRTRSNMYQFERLPIFVAYYKVDYELDPKGSNYWRNRVLMVAKDFKRKAHFAVSNEDEFSSELEEFGMSDRKSEEKPLVGARTKEGKFVMTDEFSVDNLRKFAKNVLAGNLKPYLKSEPVPETQGNVKVVVAKTFKEMVLDADKDVLIEFYAPWCGHCKALAPKYDELGDKMADEDVIIAKMDATANDVPPPFEVRGFPTLYWVPKNAKDSPKPYNGEREVDDFVKYIAEHATDELKGYNRKGKKKSKEEL